MLPEKTIRREGRIFSRELYWTYGREIVGAASYLANGRADAIILLTSFGCGPDSLMSELIVRKLKDGIPIMSLVFDEGTGEAGLLTRLESFVDMVKRTK
jgi:predicted nucleotide-binding protein (sugar kinase/HSP70/actin superfamily)